MLIKENTVYEGGVFLVDIQIPPDFPFKAPKMNFRTKLYHPFVNEDNRLSMYHLQDTTSMGSGGWSPAITLTSGEYRISTREHVGIHARSSCSQ
jgi:ubiquitin-conjugating enzyme E2 D/E